MKIQITNRFARLMSADQLTSGSVGLTATLAFSDHWDGLNKIATFSGSGTSRDVVVPSTGIVTVPAECVASHGGDLTVGVYGYTVDDGSIVVAIPTVMCCLGKIEEGSDPSGVPSSEVTPTVAEQVIAIAQSVRDDADAGVFDGADGTDGISCTHSWTGTTLNITSASGTSSADLKGEQGIQGIQGVAGQDGYTPVRGTDYWTSEDISTIDTYIDSRTEGMASQSALNATNDRLNLLYDLTRGTAWRIDNSEASSYSEAVPSGSHYADVLSVCGKSMVWNQILKDGVNNFSPYNCNITLTDGYYHVVPRGNNPYIVFPSYETINGHKYLEICDLRTDVADKNLFLRWNYGDYPTTGKYTGNGAWQRVYCILTAKNTESYANLRIQNSDINSIFDFKNLMTFDLTAFFGSGNEPSTVSQFEAMFPNSYYPYSANTIIHAAVDKVVERGANIWNEQWELGSYDSTGNAETATNTIRSKANNYIEVSPSTDYYFIFPSGCAIVVFWYDANKSFISNNTRSSNTSITAPSNARYIRFRLSTQYGTTYNNDIAIIKGTSGSYAPYHSTDHPIPSSITSLTGYGWGIGSVRNEVDFAEGKYIQRVGRVDLGTLAWANAGTRIYCDSLTDCKVVNAGVVGNLLCERYTTDTADHVYSMTTDKTIGVHGNGSSANTARLRVYDSAYTDAASFKASLAGQYLFYELQTPIETTITDQLDFAVEGGGSLAFHHAEGDNGRLIPTAHSVDYYRNVAEASE